eukprot:scaffold886_cov249-Pinguiococcus_pyrenoidosus.AAC.12
MSPLSRSFPTSLWARRMCRAGRTDCPPLSIAYRSLRKPRSCRKCKGFGAPKRRFLKLSKGAQNPPLRNEHFAQKRNEHEPPASWLIAFPDLHDRYSAARRFSSRTPDFLASAESPEALSPPCPRTSLQDAVHSNRAAQPGVRHPAGWPAGRAQRALVTGPDGRPGVPGGSGARDVPSDAAVEEEEGDEGGGRCAAADEGRVRCENEGLRRAPGAIGTEAGGDEGAGAALREVYPGERRQMAKGRSEGQGGAPGGGAQADGAAAAARNADQGRGAEEPGDHGADQAAALQGLLGSYRRGVGR